MRGKITDITGEKFGRLKVIKFAYLNTRAYWVCKCDCGIEKVLCGNNIIRGSTKSCGCLKKEGNIVFKCFQCKKDVQRIKSRMVGKNSFCSRKCRIIFGKGKHSANWIGGRIKHGPNNGYIKIYTPGHPRGHRGYVFEHTLVMEKHLKRRLRKGEEVHHLNHIRNDNRIENLKLCKDRSEHQKYDCGWWKVKGKWWKKCTICKKELEVNPKNFYRNGKSFVGACKKCR